MKKVRFNSEVLSLAILVAMMVTVVCVGDDYSQSKAATQPKTVAPAPAASASQSAAPATSSAVPTAAASTQTATVSVPSGIQILGALEIRPSYTAAPGKMGETHTENTAEFGLKLNPNTEIGWRQYFYTHKPGDNIVIGTFNLIGDDGMLRAKFSNIYENKEEGISVSYEPQLRVPTDPGKRDAGMILINRNYFTISKKVSKVVTFSLVELPIFHIYNTAGIVSGGKAVANPSIENRVYAVADFQITKDLSFEVQVLMNSLHYRDFLATAPFNNGWQHTLWTWPELDYAVNKNLTLGIAFESDNFLNYDGSGNLTGLDFGLGLQKGTAQMVLRASL